MPEMQRDFKGKTLKSKSHTKQAVMLFHVYIAGKFKSIKIKHLQVEQGARKAEKYGTNGTKV